jgi:hypothetical protein
VVRQVAELIIVTLEVERLEVPVAFSAPPKIEVLLRVVTLVLERFEVPVTLRLPPKTEEAFRVDTLVLERFEVPFTFKFVPKIEEEFKVVTLVAERFEVPDTFRDPPKIEKVLILNKLDAPGTTRLAMLAVVMTLMFDVSKLETAPLAALRIPVFEVLVLRILKKAVLAPRPPVMLAVVNQALATLAVPETLRFTRVPRDVIFDWVFESWREVSGFTRFDESRLERPDAFPKYNWEVRTSIDVPPTTVIEYPGLEFVWMATLPSGSMTMAKVVKSQNSATF